MFVQQTVNGIALGAVYALVAVGFSLMFNVMDLVNFAHGGVILIGCYAAFYAMTLAGLPPALALVPALAAGLVLSLLSERAVLRPMRRRGSPPIYFFMASFMLFTFLESLVSVLTGAQVTAYPRPIASAVFHVGGAIVTAQSLFTLLAAMLGLWGMWFVLRHTRVGLAIKMATQDPVAATLMGVDLERVTALAFGMAGVLAGAAGFFLGGTLGVYPQVGEVVYQAFIASLIGGLDSLTGAVLGAFLLGFIQTYITAYLSSDLATILTFVFLIVLLIVRPQGLLGVSREEKV